MKDIYRNRLYIFRASYEGVLTPLWFFVNLNRPNWSDLFGIRLDRSHGISGHAENTITWEIDKIIALFDL